MYERFTDRARKVMELANQEAQRFNHEYIGTEHILLGLVKEGSGVAANVLKNLDLDLARVRREVETIVHSGPDRVTMGKLPQTPRVKKAVEYAIEEAGRLGHNYVGTEHLLLGLLREQEGLAAQVLMNLGLNLEDVRQEVLNLLGLTPETVRQGAATPAKSPTPALDSFGLDLTAQARQGGLGPVVGRQGEVARVIDVLGCLKRRNPVLVGEAGVGKKVVVRGLARAIAEGTAPEPLRDRRVVAVDLAMLGSAKQPGLWLERLQATLAEARRARNLLLVPDDLHPLVGRRGRGPDALAGLFNWALARGDVQVLATATPAEYRRLRGAGEVVARHFRPVWVRPLSPGQAVEVLQAHRGRLEAGHGVQITDEALAVAAELAGLYLADEPLPGAALDLLDEAGSRVWQEWAARPAEVRAREEEVKRLEAEKEAAVAAGDFARAAAARAEEQRARQDEALQAWRRQRGVGVVDAEAVIAALSRVTGLDTETLRARQNAPARP